MAARTTRSAVRRCRYDVPNALGYTVILSLSDITARVLFDDITFSAALPAKHWAFAFPAWFVMGLALPFVVKFKPKAEK